MRLRTDWPLFATVLFMVSLGLVFVFSASSVVAEMRYREQAYFFLLRQAGAAVVALCALMLLSRWDYRKLCSERWAFTPLGIVLGLLILVYFLDRDTHRWLRLGPLSIQPSEFAKPALIVFLAYLVTLRASDINSRHTLLQAGMAMAILGGLVGNADLGTGVVLTGIAGAVFFVAGMERRYFKIAFVLAAVMAVAAVVSQPYRLQRVIHWFDAEHKILDRIDPTGTIKAYEHSTSAPPDTNHQSYQAKLAFGAGGVLGTGLMQGNQKLGFLPEAHTDFIYAIVGEELGLFGSVAVLAGVIVIFWRGLRLYWLALDDFGRYLAVGITVSIVFQAFINMSVALGLGPTKGIPLPLISYGGSSLLSTMTSLGLLLSVSERAR
ncbi:MAG: cell division protein FtsW [Bryobacteraceae bacterium]|nr:cell division protein FtsW [Bryobacteraceae bacterium]